MDLLDVAHRWHDAGLQVVPCHSDGTKRPFGSWATLQNRRLEWNETLELLNQHLDTNAIGVLLGRPSNCEMIELEGRANTPENLERMTKVAEALGIFDVWIDLNGGCVERTPSGGLHFFCFCDEEIEGNQPLAKDTEGKVLSETRGQGGFCVVTPSTGRKGHAEGSIYAFESGGPESIPKVTKQQLEKLHMVFSSIGVEVEPTPTPTPFIQPTSLRPGDDFANRTSWAEILTPHGWTFSHRSDENDHWVRPGKDKADGASATANDKYLYVFSTSVTGFQSNKAYDKFSVFTILNHAGNYQEAARALVAQGFGESLAVEVADESEDKRHYFTDLASFQGGDVEAEPVEIMGLFYRGRLNGVYGDPECGKTWLALAATAHELRLGNRACYFDLDANGGAVIAKRLVYLGVGLNVIRDSDSFRHYAPEDEDEFRSAHEEVMAFSPDFVTIDSFGEFLPLLGKDSNSNDDVSDAMRQYISPMTKAKAAVVVLDHMPKNFEARASGFAIGASAKKRRMDGSYLHMNVQQAFTPGLVGVAELTIKKDRLGGLRALHPNSRSSAGYFCLDATEVPMRWSISETNLGLETENQRQQIEVLKALATKPHHEWTQTELVNETGLNHKKLGPIIEDMLDEELIVRVGSTRSSKWPVRVNHSGLARLK